MDEKQRPWGVYIHIPFCKSKCFYCDFPSYAGREAFMSDYASALVREIERVGAIRVEEAGTPATIYIGGGTPSVLPQELLEKLLTAVRSIFLEADFPQGERARERVAAGTVEYTMECNPGTVDLDMLKLCRMLGVNRLSFGVQSFDDRLLRRLGRIHTGLEAMRSMHLARIAGFDNISMDLMYGLPEETVDDFRHDLQAMVELLPEHISVYGLQLEPGTAFYKMKENGKLKLPDEEAVEAMYDLMVDFLPAKGYGRYEISSFAKTGRESRHNLSYWRDAEYLGLGAAAHSYLGDRRYENTHDILAYIEGIREGESIRRLEEAVTEKAHKEEFCFLALRTAEGIEKAAFARTFGEDLTDAYAGSIANLKEKKLLEETETHVRLTPLGMKYGNMAFEAFLL